MDIDEFAAIGDKVNQLYERADNNLQDNDRIIGQMNRVRDGRVSSAKITVMHCVTGQKEKESMVRTTLDMCRGMYDAVDFKI